MPSTRDKSTEELLRFTRFALDNLPDAAYWVEENADITYVNDAACRMLGYTKEELLGKQVYELNPDLPPTVWPAMWQKLKEHGKRTFETRHQAKDGRIIPVEISSNFVEFNGRESSWAFARDISERQQLEARLRQAEKMEAIGQLAGGVAHDFNNQLSCILGNTELLAHPHTEPERRRLVDNILLAVKRSADLTAQLLAFSRRGKYRSEPVDLHRVLEEVVEILSRSIDKKIELVTQLDARHSVSVGDSSALQSTMLNLALNARDAMPRGGRLRFLTRNVVVRESQSFDTMPAPAPGEYVQISVADNGVGMDEETQRRLFEPFFTTKGTGKGTGLGMAAVYGTVKLHKGWVKVHSRLERGTTIEVYLPVGAHHVAAPVKTKATPLLKGPVRILLVDDEALVRDATQRLLEMLGCTVTVCSDGKQAVKFYRAFHGSIDLVILDMMMPVQDGGETVIAMRTIHPHGKILLASGYGSDTVVQSVIEGGVDDIIQKPYTQAQLWEKVVQLLTKSG